MWTLEEGFTILLILRVWDPGHAYIKGIHSLKASFTQDSLCSLEDVLEGTGNREHHFKYTYQGRYLWEASTLEII